MKGKIIQISANKYGVYALTDLGEIVFYDDSGNDIRIIKN